MRWVIGISVSLFGLLGIYLAFLLGRFEQIALFKLLNIVGLGFDIVGLLILSEFFLRNEKIVRRLSDWLIAVSMIFLLITPMGIFTGAIIGVVTTTELPSIDTVLAFAGGIMLYVGLPLYGTDSLGDALLLKFYNTAETRAKFLGWFFLLSGLVVQLVAATMDLLSKA